MSKRSGFTMASAVNSSSSHFNNPILERALPTPPLQQTYSSQDDQSENIYEEITDDFIIQALNRNKTASLSSSLLRAKSSTSLCDKDDDYGFVRHTPKSSSHNSAVKRRIIKNMKAALSPSRCNTSDIMAIPPDAKYKNSMDCMAQNKLNCTVANDLYTPNNLMLANRMISYNDYVKMHPSGSMDIQLGVTSNATNMRTSSVDLRSSNIDLKSSGVHMNSINAEMRSSGVHMNSINADMRSSGVHMNSSNMRSTSTDCIHPPPPSYAESQNFLPHCLPNPQKHVQESVSIQQQHHINLPNGIHQNSSGGYSSPCQSLSHTPRQLCQSQTDLAHYGLSVHQLAVSSSCLPTTPHNISTTSVNYESPINPKMSRPPCPKPPVSSVLQSTHSSTSCIQVTQSNPTIQLAQSRPVTAVQHSCVQVAQPLKTSSSIPALTKDSKSPCFTPQNSSCQGMQHNQIYQRRSSLGSKVPNRGPLPPLPTEPQAFDNTIDNQSLSSYQQIPPQLPNRNNLNSNVPPPVPPHSRVTKNMNLHQKVPVKTILLSNRDAAPEPTLYGSRPPSSLYSQCSNYMDPLNLYTAGSDSGISVCSDRGSYMFSPTGLYPRESGQLSGSQQLFYKDLVDHTPLDTSYTESKCSDYLMPNCIHSADEGFSENLCQNKHNEHLRIQQHEHLMHIQKMQQQQHQQEELNKQQEQHLQQLQKIQQQKQQLHEQRLQQLRNQQNSHNHYTHDQQQIHNHCAHDQQQIHNHFIHDQQQIHNHSTHEPQQIHNHSTHEPQQMHNHSTHEPQQIHNHSSHDQQQIQDSHESNFVKRAKEKIYQKLKHLDLAQPDYNQLEFSSVPNSPPSQCSDIEPQVFKSISLSKGLHHLDTDILSPTKETVTAPPVPARSRRVQRSRRPLPVLPQLEDTKEEEEFEEPEEYKGDDEDVVGGTDRLQMFHRQQGARRVIPRAHSTDTDSEYGSRANSRDNRAGSRENSRAKSRDNSRAKSRDTTSSKSRDITNSKSSTSGSKREISKRRRAKSLDKRSASADRLRRNSASASTKEKRSASSERDKPPPPPPRAPLSTKIRPSLALKQSADVTSVFDSSNSSPGVVSGTLSDLLRRNHDMQLLV